MSYNEEDLKTLISDMNAVKTELSKVIIGQEDIISKMIISLLTNSHCILQGVPGLAKTLMIQSLSNVVGADFKRIQFTPDLMPSDILGTEILDIDDNGKRNFKFIKGPVFTNILLADEINRTPPKTQSALLEAMQEREVTIAGEKHDLPKLFFVLATQNPLEQEGTYPLPEAQLDRFMFQLKLDYPSVEEEVDIVTRTTIGEKLELKNLKLISKLDKYQKIIKDLTVEKNVIEYAVQLVNATRPSAENELSKWIRYGAGPRASQNLIIAAKVQALMENRFLAEREDINRLAYHVLNHRVMLSFNAEAEGLSIKELIEMIIKKIK